MHFFHREQIARLFGTVTVKSRSLIPVRIYLTRGKVKVGLALAKGKNVVDKRDTLRKKPAVAKPAERFPREGEIEFSKKWNGGRKKFHRQI